jgi:hypothetical protein
MKPKTVIKPNKKSLGRIPLSKRPGYAFKPEKGKCSDKRTGKDWMIYPEERDITILLDIAFVSPP